MNDEIAAPSKYHVLIVDDNPTNLNVLVDYLSLTGFDVYAAEDGHSALDLLTRIRPDIILLDVMMPNIDGFETCRQIKSQPDLRDIPIIFMTALSDTRDKIRGFEAGAVDYIAKPVQHREVLARLNTHLSLRTMQARLQEQNIQLAQEIAERERVEVALRESTERYRILVENQGEGIAVLDLDERFTFANPAAEHLFGTAPGTLIDRNLTEFLAPDQIEKVRQQTEQRRQGLKSTYELEITASDGEKRHLLVTCTPWTGDTGSTIGAFGVFRDITARKQAEEQLRKLSQAVEQSPSTVVITDVEGKIEYVNPKYSQLTGYATAEAIGRTIYIPQSTETTGDAMTGLWDTVTAGQVWRGEFCNRKKDGTSFWELASISPIKNEDGAITHFVKVAEDISERKRAEDALRQYTHTLTQLNYLGQRLTATLNPQEIAIQLSHTATEIIGTDSVSVWLLENARDENHRPELVCWTSYHHFQADQKHSPVNIRLPVGQGVVGWVAQTGESLIVSDTMKDARFFPGVSEKTGFPVHALLAVPLRVRDTVIGVLEMVNKRNGDFSQNDLTLVETLAASVAIAIDNARLVEALRHYTAELETHNAELDAFAHTVAHDLKNPLSALLATTRMLETRYREMAEDRVRSSLSLLTQTGHKMTDIIDELLLLSSVRKMGDVEIEILAMSTIVEDARARLNDLIARYNADLIIPDTWPEALGYAPWIEEVWTNYISNAIKYGGDPAARVPPRIELGFALPQAFKSLTGIAIKQDYLVFWVQDNGPGLTREQQDRLFAPFERLSQKRIEGHGLGLSIVRRIVERLGGEAGVQSRPGEGSRFYFTLPGPILVTEIEKITVTRTANGLATPDLIQPLRDGSKEIPQVPSSLTPTRAPVESPSLNTETPVSETRASKGFILVVDDTLTNQLLLSQMLEMEGYDVTMASTGAEALASVKIAPPDLVLLDVNMPAMNGYEVCEHLKADPATREIPVLFISALSQTKDKVKAFTAGGVDYVVKPFQPEEVLARVETHLTLRDLQRQLMRYAQHLQQMVTEKVRELERERSKIVQMDKMAALGQMATGVAHELNQPLTAISFEADYLQTVAHKARAEQIAYDTLLNVDQLEEMGENLRGDVARCRRIIDHLRTFGRVSTDESTLINLNQPIEDCFILIGARLRNHNIHVNLNLDPDLPPILADTHRLEQVFLNLVGNAEHAVEAMEERVESGVIDRSGYQKNLAISTRVEVGTVIAEVRDNGCGMPADAQKHIFEPFFTTKPVGEGTGLGLSISYGIVTELGGEITFESTEDTGTTFTLRFPVAETP